MSAKQLKILLADDDTDDCGFFKKALAALPLSTCLIVVNDGEQLMHQLLNETNELPDVLFLDLNMPRKNGMECLAEIKQNEKFKDLPVVIFSTVNNEAVMRTLFKAGAHIYIRKPGDFKQLKEVINNAIPIASEKVFSTSRVNYVLNA
ncbi:MAG: response regulator [Flavobacteriales bacterium]